MPGLSNGASKAEPDRGNNQSVPANVEITGGGAESDRVDTTDSVTGIVIWPGFVLEETSATVPRYVPGPKRVGSAAIVSVAGVDEDEDVTESQLFPVS